METLKDRMNDQSSHARLLATVGHDLRQPLQALQLLAGSLSDASSPEECQRVGRCIESSARELGDMLDVVFDMAKLESGLLRPNIADVPVAPLIERIVAEMEPALADSGVSVQTGLEDFGVRTDTALLARMLRHLLRNVAMHAPGSTVAIRFGREDGCAVLTVQDDGPGIPAEMLERVFDPFGQVMAASGETPPGLGLGLSVARRMADLLGHDLELRSGDGRGATLRIVFPA